MKTSRAPLTFEFERSLYKNGLIACGTDEAGRGPLAGNVAAAAVILPDGADLSGINDSKKLSEKKREELFDVIVSTAVAYGIAFATPEEIDEYNILNASLLAMRRAAAMLTPSPDVILVDGNCARGFEIPAITVIGGDAKCPSIAAASILAKVTRDRQMYELDAKYPQYGFAKHKGYPTKEHMAAVREYGPVDGVYRKSFLGFLER
ncbi:MAG: ribonuclease HII [Clostridia bacterium]|nr:ribonuclease HII [Clostridia bacterium]